VAQLTLKPFQREAIALLESGANLLCIAPTGSGKSLIFETFAQRRWTRMLLVSPLVALARQQAARLEGLGVRVGRGFTAGDGVWLTSPEGLDSPHAGRALDDWRPNFLVVDECHCFWEWGESFRPAFQGLPGLLRRYEAAKSLWLTATLPWNARLELRRSIPGPLIEMGAFELPRGIRVHVQQTAWPDRAARLLAWARTVRGPGLVFVGTREASVRISRFLGLQGLDSAPYHAGMSSEERRLVEDDARRGKSGVVVATSAFGLGMDLPSLRWVVLWQPLGSLLSMAQAIGRVGRGGAEGDALLLWSPEDFQLLEWTIGGSERRRRELLEVQRFFVGTKDVRSAFRSYFEAHAEQAGGCQTP
jgi:ATP-dependent DNA helicase RecQ